MKHLLIILVFLTVITGFALAAEKVILVGSGAPADIDGPILQLLKKWDLM